MKDEERFQDADLMLFHRVIAFNDYRNRIILIVNIKADELETNYHKALPELEEIARLIRKGDKAEAEPLTLKTDFKPLFSREEYCRMVEEGKKYIREGDIFQVVLSNRLEAEMEGSLLEAYRILRDTNINRRYGDAACEEWKGAK